MKKDVKVTKEKVVRLEDLQLDAELLKNVVGGESGKNKNERTA